MMTATMSTSQMASYERPIRHRILLADEAIWKLGLPEYTWQPEEAEDYRSLCGCGRWESQHCGDNEDHLCQDCWDEQHFACEDCRAETDIDERDEEHLTCCTDCGEARREATEEERQEKAIALRTELEQILDGWCDDDGEIEKLTKLIKAAKRLK